MSARNKSIVKDLLEKSWNAKDLQVIDAHVANQYVDHTAPPCPGTAELQGPAQLKEVIARMQNIFFSVSVTVGDQVAEGDKVATSVVWECTFRDNANPANPAQTVSVRNIGIDRIGHGKLVESWNTLDVPYRFISQFNLQDPFINPGVPIPPGPPCDPRSRQPCLFGRICVNGICVKA